jgi:TctA family transporter
MTYALVLFAGTLYGFLFGLIPIAGATVALITIYSFIEWFCADPYLLVTFTTAVVVSCSIGDLFASVVMNIPGGGGSAATMVDGFPMAKQGQAGRALSAAIFTSVLNGLIWGIVVFFFLPFYGVVVLKFAIPEMLAFIVLAFVCVSFINSKYWFRGILALMLGILVGMIGMHHATGAARFTFGWDYMKAGIQIVPLMAGIMALPELIQTYNVRSIYSAAIIGNVWDQIKQGLKDSITHVKDGLKGGVIGGFIGLIPGVGGAICDWLAYGVTTAAHPNEKIPFGEGNVKGVIGPEGANMAQKATAYVPTILFGIPAAPFEVIVMSLFMIVGLEMGTPDLLTDMTFFHTLTISYMWALAITFIISLVFIRYAVLITKVPFKIYFWALIVLITWASVQYTGYWEDYVMLGICTVLGVALKYLKFSRAAFIIGFVLSPRFETLLSQYTTLYEPMDILTRPISMSLLAVATAAAIYGVFFNKTRISYV